MGKKSRPVFLELSEHDALQLIALINQEIDRTEKAWQPYWARVVQNIQQGIEHAASSASRHHLSCLKDMPGNDGIP